MLCINSQTTEQFKTAKMGKQKLGKKRTDHLDLMTDFLHYIASIGKNNQNDSMQTQVFSFYNILQQLTLLNNVVNYLPLSKTKS